MGKMIVALGVEHYVLFFTSNGKVQQRLMTSEQDQASSLINIDCAFISTAAFVYCTIARVDLVVQP